MDLLLKIHPPIFAHLCSGQGRYFSNLRRRNSTRNCLDGQNLTLGFLAIYVPNFGECSYSAHFDTFDRFGRLSTSKLRAGWLSASAPVALFDELRTSERSLRFG
jgi:hypothetical protein